MELVREGEERSICGIRLPRLWEGMQLNAKMESILYGGKDSERSGGTEVKVR